MKSSTWLILGCSNPLQRSKATLGSTQLQDVKTSWHGVTNKWV